MAYHFGHVAISVIQKDIEHRQSQVARTRRGGVSQIETPEQIAARERNKQIAIKGQEEALAISPVSRCPSRKIRIGPLEHVVSFDGCSLNYHSNPILFSLICSPTSDTLGWL